MNTAALKDNSYSIEALVIEVADTAIGSTVRRALPKPSGPPSAAYYGTLGTLRTSLTPGVLIRTETQASRRRNRGEMTQPKLATLLRQQQLTHAGTAAVEKIPSTSKI